MLCQVGLDELGEREPPCDPPLPPYPIKLALERLARVLCADEPASLNTLGVAPARAVAKRPQPLTIACRTRQLNYLSPVASSLKTTPSRVDPPPIEILHLPRSPL